MREIIFRGKRVDNNKWVYGLPLYGNFDTTITEMQCFINCKHYIFEVIIETIGQFTGLTDKNGVKIFEGDKIKYNNWIGVVKYSTGAFYICYGDGTESEFNEMSESDLEIIGNIYETNK